MKILKDELQHIISGAGAESESSLIQTAQRFLRGSESTGAGAQRAKRTKEQETTALIAFAGERSLWYNEPLHTDFQIGEGAEQKVFFKPETQSVLKLNDTIFYVSWIDYFNSLLLHNYFFPDTAYTLKGFYKTNETLFAVVEQPFIKRDKETDLKEVEAFLRQNGFVKTNPQKQDYHNDTLGIILEDLHDENVLTAGGLLFFVDTVFYLTEDFYK